MRGQVNARFLKDRASLLALIIPAVWLFWHRLWLAFAVYLVFAFFLAAIGATEYARRGSGVFTFCRVFIFFSKGPI